MRYTNPRLYFFSITHSMAAKHFERVEWLRAPADDVTDMTADWSLMTGDPEQLECRHATLYPNTAA